MKIILLDLFSGIGGFAKGLEDAVFEIVEHFFSEVDTHAIANYKYNFPHAKHIGSVTFVRHIIRTVRQSLQQHPNCKLVITFGSPCQDFSMAGNRAGLKGNKSSLIKFALFLIKWLRPELYIWENVKGTYSSNSGKDFWAIQKAFADIDGYRREQQLVNTSWLLPQNRERIYLVGQIAEPGRSFGRVFPITENDQLFNEETKPQPQTKNSETVISSSLCGTGNMGMHRDATYVGVPKISGCLTGGGHSGGLHSDMTTIISIPHGYYKGSESEISPAITTKSFEHNRVYDDSGISPNLETGTRWKVKVSIIEPEHKHGEYREYEDNAPTIQARYGTGGNNAPYVSVQPVLTPERLEKRQNGRRFKEDGEPAFTLNCQDQHGIMIDNYLIRRLTEIECERLQGFDDDWTKWGIYKARNSELKRQPHKIIIIDSIGYIKREVPKTQRYKMLGNAVTKKMVELIGSRYLSSINSQIK